MYRRIVTLFLIGIMALSVISGCGKEEKKISRIRDMEYTVLDEEGLPEELEKAIEEKKENSFKLTYLAEDYLYIAVGYGKQDTGGYSISVNDLYLTQNAIYIETRLYGPREGEEVSQTVSYPYVVVKTEAMDMSVVFD